MNQRGRWTSFIALFAVLLCIRCSGYESASDTNVNLSGGDPVNGQLVYNNAGSPGNKCSDCHAADGSGVWPYPDIRNATAEQIASAVRVGPLNMPAYTTGEISNSELSDLIAYVLTL